jgi:hypothetical protein
MKHADMTGIPPEEYATGASVIDRPASDEEEHVGEADLGESDGAEEEEQTEHRRIGFPDGNGEQLRKVDAERASAKPDRRTYKQRKTEEERLGGCLAQVTCNGS